MVVLVQSKGEKPDPSLERLAHSVWFGPLSPDRLEKWIRHRARLEGVELDEEAASHLKEAVGDDMPQLAAEIAKLAGAVRGRPISVADVTDLLGVRRGETVHAFVDAVTGRDFGAAVTMVRHLLEMPGNSGVRLVIALSTSLHGVAMARAFLDRGDNPRAITDALFQALNGARPFGLRKWGEEASRWVKDARGWTMDGVDHALSELLRADRRLKNTTLGGEIEIVTEAVLGMAGK
jgi:DNA polymerase III delta subunit